MFNGNEEKDVFIIGEAKLKIIFQGNAQGTLGYMVRFNDFMFFILLNNCLFAIYWIFIEYIEEKN